jgi:hypothetical protein
MVVTGALCSILQQHAESSIALLLCEMLSVYYVKVVYHGKRAKFNYEKPMKGNTIFYEFYFEARRQGSLDASVSEGSRARRE